MLLSNSVPRGAISVCPLAFGEVGVKERVKRVLDKRPTKVLIALALVLCLVIGVCFATSPREEIIYGLSGGTYVMDEADAVQILPVAGDLPDVRQPSGICIYAQPVILLLYGGGVYTKR